MRIYVDANIYLDYFESRGDGIRPLQEFAFQVFKRTIDCEFEIVVSDWLIRELQFNIQTKTKADLLFAELLEKRKLAFIQQKQLMMKEWPAATKTARMLCKLLLQKGRIANLL